MDLKNAEFKNLKLAQIYEDFNQFSEDEDFWLSIIKDLNISDITDFWCGTWLFTHQLMEQGYKVRGIEPEISMLLQAKSKEWSNNIEYIEWDYKKLENFSTELILMTSHVSQFIEDTEWEKFLQRSYKVLKKWWYLLFDSKNPLLKPWENYTREKYNRTKPTKFWPVNMQIETNYILWNEAEHSIYYTFLNTWEEFISRNKLIYRTKEKIEESLVKSNFHIVKMYWWWDFTDYNNKSEEMIFLAKK